MLWDEIRITYVPICQSDEGCFRDFAGKHFNILCTAQIFTLVTSTFFCDLKKDIRGRRFLSVEEVQEWLKLWIHQRTTSFYKTEIDPLFSQWDKCINTSVNYFCLKQIALSLSSGCSVFISLPLILITIKVSFADIGIFKKSK